MVSTFSQLAKEAEQERERVQAAQPPVQPPAQAPVDTTTWTRVGGVSRIPPEPKVDQIPWEGDTPSPTSSQFGVWEDMPGQPVPVSQQPPPQSRPQQPQPAAQQAPIQRPALQQPPVQPAAPQSPQPQPQPAAPQLRPIQRGTVNARTKREETLSFGEKIDQGTARGLKNVGQGIVSLALDAANLTPLVSDEDVANYDRQAEADRHAFSLTEAGESIPGQAGVLAGELLPGLVFGGAALKAGKNITEAIGTVPTMMAGGAMEGALVANPSDQLTGAGIGAVAGPTAVGLLKLGGMGGKKGLEFILDKTRKGEHRAAKEVARAFRRDMNDNSEAYRELAETYGEDAMLLDLGGENVRELANVAAGSSAAGKRQMQGRLDTRNEGRNPRVTDELNRSLGDSENFITKVDEIIEKRRVEADPLYKAAYAVNIPRTKELSELLRKPTMQAALRAARRMAADEGVDFPDATLISNGEEFELIPTEMLDYAKRGIDQLFSSKRYKNQTTGRLTTWGHIANGLRKDLIKQITDANSAYGTAIHAFAGRSRMLEALREGTNFLNLDSQITIKQLKALSDSEKEFFKQGAAKAIRDKTLSSPYESNVYQTLFGNDILKERMRAVFPSDKAFKQFEDRVLAEQKMFNTRKGFRPAAPQEARVAAREGLEDPTKIEMAAQVSALGRVWDSIRVRLRNRRKIDPKLAQDVANILSTEGLLENAAQLARLEDYVAIKSPNSSGLLTRAINLAAGGAAGDSASSPYRSRQTISRQPRQ